MKKLISNPCCRTLAVAAALMAAIPALANSKPAGIMILVR